MTNRHAAILFALSVIWGASFLFIKVQLDAGLEPLGVASLRTALGAAALLPFALRAAPDLRLTRRRVAILAGLSVANFAIPWTLIAVAEHHISSGMASIANSTAPLWAALLAIAFLHEERVNLARGLGLLLGFTGILILAGPASVLRLTSEALGVGLVLLSTLSYAAAAIVIRRTMAAVPPSVVAFGQVVAAAALLAPVAFATGAFTAAEWSTEAILAALALGILGSGIAVVAYMGLIRDIGAVRSTLVTYLIPPWGVLLGAAFLGEPLSWNLLLGLAVILAGILLVQGAVRRSPRRPPEPAASPALGR